MKIETVEYLAYLIKEAKTNGTPKPIVFLGAGASKSGGIPDAREITNMILTDFSNNPKIKNIEEKNKNYAYLMDIIGPAQRNILLKKLIDKAKINVTHIYLAQMMKQGFIDYFLTVNFDNLMLRALALFNEFPPTYDLAVLNEITTTSFYPDSITYLHGQHTGLWLLNTHDEMDKPKDVIPAILHQIKNGRTWVVLGYSGSDPIFDHIVKLGRFDNGLYWVGYNENLPAENVTNKLLNKPNSNSYLIQGYDSDSFCMKLNKELECGEPTIFDTPFTFLHNVQNNIVDIDNSDTYKNVKERLDISKKMVDDAIGKYEHQEKLEMTNDDINFNIIKKEIINAIVKEDYENANGLYDQYIILNNLEINNLLSRLYSNWGTDLGKLAETLQGDEQKKYFDLAFDKFEKATTINPKYDMAYSNWGNGLGNLAEKLQGDEQKKYFDIAFDKYEKATTINPKKDNAYSNWGIDLGNLAETLQGDEQKKHYDLAFDKYEKATTINPKNDTAYYNWGSTLINYAKKQPEPQKTFILNQSLKVLNKAFILNGKYYNLSCVYALSNEKYQALQNLDFALKNNEITTQEVINDDDWKDFLTDEYFLNLINKYSN